MKASLVAALGAGMALPALGVLFRYRRAMNAARARLAAVDRHVVSTEWGAVEYAEQEALFHGDRPLMTGVYDGVPGFSNVENTVGEPATGDGIPDTAFFQGPPGITAGDRVDVYATYATARPYTAVVADDVAVLGVDRSASDLGGGGGVGALTVAVDAFTAQELARADATAVLAVAVRGYVPVTIVPSGLGAVPASPAPSSTTPSPTAPGP